MSLLFVFENNLLLPCSNVAFLKFYCSYKILLQCIKTSFYAFINNKTGDFFYGK